MDYKIALFDVDGTIINGNCTDLFLQYLFDENQIDKNAYTFYHKHSRKHINYEANYLNIASEAFKILSELDLTTLSIHWENCFYTRIKKKFNPIIINQIKSLKKNQFDVFLASGSPKILIKKVGQDLGIRIENIIATEFNTIDDRIISESPNPLCIGIGKEKAVLKEFEARAISLNEVRFYSDNLSDLDLLESTGYSYWLGNESDYKKHRMRRRGIEKFLDKNWNNENEKVPPVTTDSNLSNYYVEKKTIIEESISSIFPPVCSLKSIRDMVGETDNNWDIETLQRSYFDPVNEYIHKKDQWIISLGPCIFLEAAGLKIDPYIPIISIPELLNISHDIFTDIIDWTSNEQYNRNVKSHLEISVYGNASLSLLTLPVHGILLNDIRLDKDQKLRFYEMYTSIVFDSLFGNGIKFYWEQQEYLSINIEEYLNVAKLTNKGIFQYTIGIFSIIANQKDNQILTNDLNALHQNVGILIQLKKDHNSYTRWLNQLSSIKSNPFVFKTNLLGIHSRLNLGNKTLGSIEGKREDIEKIVKDADSLEFLDNKIMEYQNLVIKDLMRLPFEKEYRNLLLSYINYLIQN